MNETKRLPFVLNLQHFADPEPTDPAPATPPEIDYEKLADIVGKRTAKTEESAIKGILKEQGLSKEEMEDAFKMYKEQKNSKARAEQERIDNILKENAAYKQKELLQSVNDEVKAIAKELGVREDRVAKLMALCDQKVFIDDKGVIDKISIKAELEKQLKEVPEFKATKRVTITTASGIQSPAELTDEEAYRQRKYGKNKYYRGR